MVVSGEGSEAVRPGVASDHDGVVDRVRGDGRAAVPAQADPRTSDNRPVLRAWSKGALHEHGEVVVACRHLPTSPRDHLPTGERRLSPAMWCGYAVCLAVDDGLSSRRLIRESVTVAAWRRHRRPSSALAGLARRRARPTSATARQYAVLGCPSPAAERPWGPVASAIAMPQVTSNVIWRSPTR